MQSFLDFEKPIANFSVKIAELRSAAEDGVGISDEIAKLERQAEEALTKLYSELTPWQKTSVARHPDRPHTLHYIHALIDDYNELAGDRYYGQDDAMIAGIGRFQGRSVAIIGQEKGFDTDSRLKHNFGMAMPEGYRKAVRLMKLAEQFRLPVIAFVDTAGAYPGISAEERGQAEAIAASIEACLNLTVPNIALVIGEGGSGGAVAIATANKVLMMEHAVYTVASPEASASILWRDATRASDAATNMMITAQHLKTLGLIDRIIQEPSGGAHRNQTQAIQAAADEIKRSLDELSNLSPNEIKTHRRNKFLAMGRADQEGSAS